MALARTAAAPERSQVDSVALRVQVVAPAPLGATAVAALRARGLDARSTSTLDETSPDLVALALEAPLGAAAAVELAAACARAAASGRPMCILAPPPRGLGRAAIERAAAVAILRSHGAVLGHDVDTWLEAVVALVCFGMPRGPRTAVIAPPGSWLEAQTVSLVGEADALGARAPVLSGDHHAKAEPTDVVLFDPELTPAPAHLPGHALAIHVAARGELALGRPVLHGMRAAIGAIELLGRAAERIAAEVGPATEAGADLELDRVTMRTRFAKLSGLQRVGDHETKGLLAAYGVAITRQAVATTPSAAVAKARLVSYPVELKPWGHDIATEPNGCPIERDVTSDARVRSGFSSVLAAAGQPLTGAIIVREKPPLGRDLSAQLVRLPSLGWTVVLEINGQVVAAPAPLRAIDAQVLASSIVASRAADAEPDRAGLAMLLRRASHLVIDLETELVRLELPRIVVGGRGSRTVVVDAWCELSR